MDIRNKVAIIIVALIAICFPQASLGQQNTTLEITSFGNLNGYDGYFQEMRIGDELVETDFYFEENGYIRWYAFKMHWHDEFQTRRYSRDYINYQKDADMYMMRDRSS